MKTKQNFGDYLQFSKKDRIAIIIIASILLTAFLLPSLLEHSASLPESKVPRDTAWIAALKKLERPAAVTGLYERNEENSNGKYNAQPLADRYNNGHQAELFIFDPNTLDKAGWARLGVREKTIGTIHKYLEKGGKFRQAGDLRKIYGLQPDQIERLIPYIRISSAHPSPILPGAETSRERDNFRGSRSIRPVDINKGDSLAFESLPGIGPVLASRIIRFREKLGGFFSIVQVRETFGISDSLFSVIKPYLQISELDLLQKIDINSIDLNGLRKHPYIKYDVATAIINYRTQHGMFTSAEKLKHVLAIDEVLYEKLIPYFNFSQ
ncbi:helix-hairpin-helix domain-containing protein [Terrimonas sp. NA20]|uniref:Helix-hairpin-helix domain-containing protein n=1 Tax=Terrimonas ginsenosidimutans TaxID=2908004 RepID=A0ABS9KTZ2_9BACT|nr:helix-hairpin-helix domain-containing protein [Terrimonas ginsenosidimutans]MCG2615801.1 helix-hairpin-helix domain-containing protein [Terrimonas ginsenosidimutans]